MRKTIGRLGLISVVLIAGWVACSDDPPPPPPNEPPPDQDVDAGPQFTAPRHVLEFQIERLREANTESVSIRGHIARYEPSDTIPAADTWPAADTCEEVAAADPDVADATGAGIVTVTNGLNAPLTLEFEGGAYHAPGDELPSNFFGGGDVLDLAGEGSDQLGVFTGSVTAPTAFNAFTINNAPLSTDPNNLVTNIPRASFIVKWGSPISGNVYMTLTGPDADTDAQGDLTFRCTATDDADGFQVSAATLLRFESVTENTRTGRPVLISVWRRNETDLTGTNVTSGKLRAVMKRTYQVLVTN